jgi:hypothetical protein
MVFLNTQSPYNIGGIFTLSFLSKLTENCITKKISLKFLKGGRTSKENQYANTDNDFSITLSQTPHVF